MTEEAVQQAPGHYQQSTGQGKVDISISRWVRAGWAAELQQPDKSRKLNSGGGSRCSGGRDQNKLAVYSEMAIEGAADVEKVLESCLGGGQFESIKKII